MLQLVQLVAGAVLVLAGFGLTQVGMLDLRSYAYLTVTDAADAVATGQATAVNVTWSPEVGSLVSPSR